jgi:hypothetical protein
MAGRVFGKAAATSSGDLHEFDLTGTHTRSYGTVPKPESRWEAAFVAEFAATADDEIITGAMNSSRLRFYTPRTNASHWMDIAPGWQPIQWPSDGLLRRGTSQQSAAQRIVAWERTQRLLNGAFVLPGKRFLIRYLGFTPVGERLYYYVLADASGHTLATTHATRAYVFGVRADTLVWFRSSGSSPRVGYGVLRPLVNSVTAISSSGR